MRFPIVAAAFTVICLGSTASLAASPETKAFVADVRLDSTFLQTSSALAADRSDNAGLRDFAADEADAEKGVVAALDSRSVPLASLAASDSVMTGRSVAVDRNSSYEAPEGLGASMPATMVTLEHLASSKGQAFDTLYRITQTNALRQMSGLYDAYARTGDDAALRQVAKLQLDATNARLAQLSQF